MLHAQTCLFTHNALCCNPLQDLQQFQKGFSSLSYIRVENLAPPFQIKTLKFKINIEET